jgi:peroxiredoxin
VDDREHALLVWDKVLNRQFTVLSDPGARVIHSYGLTHPGAGRNGEDIALDTSILIDRNGRESWRRVSATLPDLPTPDEILSRIRGKAPETQHKGPDQKPSCQN